MLYYQNPFPSRNTKKSFSGVTTTKIQNDIPIEIGTNIFVFFAVLSVHAIVDKVMMKADVANSANKKDLGM